MQTANEEYIANKTEQAGRLERAEEKAQTFAAKIDAVNTKLEKAEASLAEKDKEKLAVQGELDDLLMVFGDLEDKVSRYKERLKALGESVSNGEEDEDDEDGDSDVD